MRVKINDICFNYAYVTNTNNRLVVSSILYQTEYDNTDVNDYKIGDIVKLDLNQCEIYNQKNKLKNNLYYKCHNKPVKTSYYIPSLRRYLSNKIAKIDDDNIRAFLNKYILSINDYVNLEDTFLDMSFSMYGLFLILDKLTLKYFKSKTRCILLVYLILGILDFNLTSLRIIIMILYYNHSKDKTYALALSGLILMLYNPYCVFSYSFIIPFILRMLNNFKNDLDIKTILILLESNIFGSVPILKIFFYKYYLIINMFLYPFTIIGLCFNSNIVNYTYYFIKNIESLNAYCLKGKINLLVIIAFLAFIKTFNIKNKLLINTILVLCVSSNISNLYGSVTFIDVGQGDSILIKSPFNKENILIDTGSEYNYYKLTNYLDRKGIYQIDYLIISHFDKDHSGNLHELIFDYNVQNIIYSRQNLDTEYFKFISLNNEEWNNQNDNSVVYSMRYNNLNFLFTGDISKKVEYSIIDKYPDLNIDILKLSHHGSNTASSMRFLYYINPKIAIASTSGMYNHPSDEVLDNCNKLKIKTLITKDVGDIEFIMTKLLTFIYAKNGEFVIIK